MVHVNFNYDFVDILRHPNWISYQSEIISAKAQNWNLNFLYKIAKKFQINLKISDWIRQEKIKTFKFNDAVETFIWIQILSLKKNKQNYSI